MATPISGLLERLRNGLSRFWGAARKGLHSGLGEVRWTPPPWVRAMRVRFMNGRALVQRYKRASLIRQAALDLTAEVRPKDWAGEVRAVFAFVRETLERPHPAQKEFNSLIFLARSVNFFFIVAKNMARFDFSLLEFLAQ